MNAVDNILSRLDGVKQTGVGTWRAHCPAHDNRNGLTLSIRETDDDRVLLHCFAECSVDDILAAVDLDASALFPPRPKDHRHPPERRPFPAADALRAIAFESLVVVASAATMQAGQPFTDADRERLVVAAARIQAALTVVGVAS